MVFIRESFSLKNPTCSKKEKEKKKNHKSPKNKQTNKKPCDCSLSSRFAEIWFCVKLRLYSSNVCAFSLVLWGKYNSYSKAFTALKIARKHWFVFGIPIVPAYHFNPLAHHQHWRNYFKWVPSCLWGTWDRNLEITKKRTLLTET